jgi:hypothetical protein
MQKPLSPNSDELFFEDTVVAFFDIVGYSAFLAANSDFEEAVKKIRKLFKSLSHTSTTDFYGVKFESWILSDSFILAVDTRQQPIYNGSLNLLTATCSYILFEAICFAGLPLRGAIGVGNFYKSEDLMVSTALIDAVTYEKKQDWLGAMFTPKAEKYINERCSFFADALSGKNSARDSVKRGKVPLKEDFETEYFYIQPHSLPENVLLEDVLPVYFDKTKLLVANSKALYEKNFQNP